MFAAPAASRRTLFPEPASKASRLNYEGDVKTKQFQQGGFSISFDMKTGMPKSVTTSTFERKPFCKVCHDAGKPEVIYTSHYVRASPAPDAPVVCPTLLAQPCRYCNLPGHTVKYCPSLPTNTTTAAVVAPTLPTQTQPVVRRVTRNEMDFAINRFAALSVESSSDEETESECEMKVDEFDEIKNLSLQTLTAMLSSIVQMNPTSDNKLVIAVEKAIGEKTKTNNKARPPFCSPLPSPNKPKSEVATAVAVSATTNTKTKSWADCDDDEIDFTSDLPNFPALPPPSLKRSYADITKL